MQRIIEEDRLASLREPLLAAEKGISVENVTKKNSLLSIFGRWKNNAEQKELSPEESKIAVLRKNIKLINNNNDIQKDTEIAIATENLTTLDPGFVQKLKNFHALYMQVLTDHIDLSLNCPPSIATAYQDTKSSILDITVRYDHTAKQLATFIDNYDRACKQSNMSRSL